VTGAPAGREPDPLALRDVARGVALEAGSLVRGSRPADLRVATKSSPTDVVTATDHASEALMRARLREVRPHDAIMGEEGDAERGVSGLTWVLDPIDGTVNYLYGIPAYAVSVAVVTGDPSRPGAWTPVAGCVLDAASGEVWTAAAGQGAWLDGRPIRIPEPPPLERALVATGFGYVAERRARQGAIMAALLPRIRDVRRIGSAALDLCMVAAGRADAYYEQGTHVWDVAAAGLVVVEAGGAMRGLGSHPPGEAMVVSAAEPLCARLAAELEALGAGG
jgi:myo-inositol-1(or 4)-monophosphatase